MEIQDECATPPMPQAHPAGNGAVNRWTATPPIRPNATPPQRDRHRLTALEHDVLNGLAAGLSEREIALRLMLFEPEVRAALRAMFRKLRVRSREEAVAHAASRRDEIQRAPR